MEDAWLSSSLYWLLSAAPGPLSKVREELISGYVRWLYDCFGLAIAGPEIKAYISSAKQGGLVLVGGKLEFGAKKPFAVLDAKITKPSRGDGEPQLPILLKTASSDTFTLSANRREPGRS